MKKTKIQVLEKDLIDLIHWARRYCDKRATFEPTSFNEIYSRIRCENPDFIKVHDKIDHTLREKGKFWPYAQDGHFNEKTKEFNAVPKFVQEVFGF